MQMNTYDRVSKVAKQRQAPAKADTLSFIHRAKGENRLTQLVLRPLCVLCDMVSPPHRMKE